jgi:hypothetical protein
MREVKESRRWMEDIEANNNDTKNNPSIIIIIITVLSILFSHTNNLPNLALPNAGKTSFCT